MIHRDPIFRSKGQLNEGKSALISVLNLWTNINIYILHHPHPNHTKRSIVYNQGLRVKGYVLKIRLFEAFEEDEVMVP